jgi:flagellar biosynthesis regulator FlaF
LSGNLPINCIDCFKAQIYVSLLEKITGEDQSSKIKWRTELRVTLHDIGVWVLQVQAWIMRRALQNIFSHLKEDGV